MWGVQAIFKPFAYNFAFYQIVPAMLSPLFFLAAQVAWGAW